ncbi:hypothetical protein ACJMK2_027122 [Sinanodonta woodiana]|uniref:Cytochrome P450 n=1 Tax=Sinanodonta woodiana TaxID=1069815 RepID=A0ABD3XM58_SINWO
MRLLKENSEISKRWFESIIQEHRNSYKKGTDRDFIDIFISEASEREEADEISTFTDLQLYMLIRDIIGAGTETTATTIRWILLQFLHFPEIQDKCSRK